MNRTYLLIALLIMFLSCGNSTGIKRKEEKIEFKKVITLSREQKVVASKLDEMFNNFHRAGLFNGSVLVAKGEKIIFKKSLGIANRVMKTPITDSSMFQLASVSKVITATAVMLLHEREMIDINRPYNFYFPDFPYEGVTIKHLLDHRSGLPNYLWVLNEHLWKPNYQMTNEDMYNFLVKKNARRIFRPDWRFDYNNTNYALLAYLVEKISGKPFNEFVKEELFKPLGMKHSGTIRDVDHENDGKVTKPYDNRWRPVATDASDYVLGDKSIYASAYDLYLLSDAMYKNKILKPETQVMAYTPYSRETRQTNYGLGWRMKDFYTPDKKEVYHNGWWHGYRSSFHRRLRDSLTVIVLSNQLNHAAYYTGKVYEVLDSTIGTIGDEESDDE